MKFEQGGGSIDGCKITGAGYYGIKVVPGADHVTVDRTEVGYTVAGGIDVVNGDYLTIRDSYIHDTGSDAIMVKGGAFGVVIERNRIENSRGTGIDGGQWTDAVWFDRTQNPGLFEIVEPVIRNNIVIGTDYAGIALYGALRPEVSNNTLINTARIGQASIYVASNERFTTNTDPRIVNNIVTRTVSGPRPLVFITRDGFTGSLTMDHNRYDNAGSDAAFWSQRAGHEFYGSFASWQMTLGLDADSSLGDPGIDAGGRIRADSRIIDAGRSLGSVVDDFDREPRTGAYDIGADEYPAASRVAPSAPGNLVAQGTSSGRIALSWAGSAGADSYLLERSADGQAGWSQVGTAPAGVTTWHDTGLAAATTYHYRVRAANAAGRSPYSNTADVTTAADPTPPPPPPGRSSGLRAEFFDLTADTPALPDLAGRVADIVRVDARLAYASTGAVWEGLDGRFADTFAARHTGYLRVEAAGRYTLHLDSDDGSRLWLDGELLIDNDGLHPMIERSATRTLAAGDHALRVEYFENIGYAGLVLSWTGPGGPKELVPAANLVHDDG